METNRKYSVGVISDTHGLMRAEALAALQGVDLIVHAGDIGKPQVVQMLRKIAPVVAVRGNMDRADWARTFPEWSVAKIGEVTLYVLHDLQGLDLDPSTAGFSAVIFGHSHEPHASWQNGVLYLNPGSAGPRRFRLPLSVAILSLDAHDLESRFAYLEP